MRAIRSFFEMILTGNSDEKEKTPETPDDNEETPIDDEGLMKEKLKKTGYQTMIRIVVTSKGYNREDSQYIAESELKNIISAFSQFASPAYNRFRTMRYKSISLLVEYYILRQFAFWQGSFILNVEEIATLFHFPHSKYNRQPEIAWQRFKLVKAPINIAKE